MCSSHLLYPSIFKVGQCFQTLSIQGNCWWSQAPEHTASGDAETQPAPVHHPQSPVRDAHEHGDSQGRILPRIMPVVGQRHQKGESHQNAAPGGHWGGEGWVVSVSPRRSGLSSEDKRSENPGQQPGEHRGQEKHTQSSLAPLQSAAGRKLCASRLASSEHSPHPTQDVRAPADNEHNYF